MANYTRFAAAGSWGRDKDGVHEWIVAVRGTFAIHSNGAVTPAEEQPEPLLLPQYYREDGISSLRYDADFVGAKPSTDVLLNGTAYAPGGRPTTEFPVSLRVGKIRKVLKVLGNRVWEKGVFGSRPSRPEPVKQVPIVYERAYGGFDRSIQEPRKQCLDLRNPVGCGMVARDGEALPNFEYTKGSLEKIGPAGFGALASFWSPRRELAGTYDENWKRTRFPLLPEDWDAATLQCAPVDQRPAGRSDGGEVVELENLTPDGMLRFKLPSIHLRFRTRVGTRSMPHEAWLSTIILEPDHPRVILVWQSTMTMRGDVEDLDKTVVTEESAML